MGVPAPVTDRTYENFIFDAGVLVRNYDAAQTLAAQENNWIGATSGGGSFMAKAMIISPKIDGIPDTSSVKGADRISGWSASIKANFIEISRDLITDMLPGTSFTDDGDYDTIVPGDIALADYMDSLALVVTHSANPATSAPEGAVFIIKNARGNGEFNADFKFNDNTVVAAEFVATYDGSAMTDPIWEILMPRATHAVS